MSPRMYLIALNSLITCFMIASSYGIACSWAIMKKIDRVEEPEAPEEPEEECDEEKLKRSETLTTYIEILLNYADENPDSTIGEFLSLHPVPVEILTKEETSTSPLVKHIALLERFNDELQEANSMWVEHADEIIEQKKEIAHDRETIKTMMYTSLTCLFIMVTSYAMVIYTHILVR